MPDKLDGRIERALRAEVEDLPMAILPSMVEERLERAVGGVSLPLVGATIAAALVLAVVVSADWWARPEPGASSQTKIVRSDEPIVPLGASAPAVCLVVERDASGDASTWWYSPGAPADCATTNSSLVEVGGRVSPTGDDGAAYSFRFLVQLITGNREFVEIATTLRFPEGDEPYFTTTNGPVGATTLDRVEVPTAFGSAETPLPTPDAGTRPPSPDPAIADCVTTQPVRAPDDIGDRLFGSGSAYGNDDLWVGGLGPDGVIVVTPGLVEDDGSIGWKLGWWRNVRGTLEITGRRLDGDAPPLAAGVPDGYGSSGFQASGVSFPTAGCWEVNGRVADAELTFVTLVLDVEAEVERLFAETDRCRVLLAGIDLDVAFPASWSTSPAVGAHPGCLAFDPNAIEVHEESGSIRADTAVTLGAVGGTEEPRSRSDTVVGRRAVTVAGMPAIRIEVAEADTGVERLTYWIAVGPDIDRGPTTVATTTTDGGGNYALNKAVLDQMMTLLTIGD